MTRWNAIALISCTLILSTVACGHEEEPQEQQEQQESTGPETCAAPDDVDTVQWRAWGVIESEDEGGREFTVFNDEATLRDTIAGLEDTDLQIDFGEERLVQAVIPGRNQGEVAAVFEEDDRVVIYISSPRYCGGFPPLDRILWIVIPIGTKSVEQEICTWGECTGPEAP